MIGIRNTFAAGTTVLSVIAAPAAVPIRSAVAATAPGTVAVAPVLADSANGAANGGGPRRVGRTLSGGVAVAPVLAGSADGAANGGGPHHGGRILSGGVAVAPVLAGGAHGAAYGGL